MSFLTKQLFFENHKKKKRNKNLQINNADIKIENLSKEYHNNTIFKQANLTLEAGKTYCIMGPSGCGKTTLLHILLGLVKPEQGRINGITKQEVSAVFQEPRLLNEYTAIENAFLFGMYSKGYTLDLQEFKKILPEDAASKLVKELSGGMQRRVAIIRAMVADSALIVLDEPFSGLDEETKKKTADYILEKKGTRTLIVSTHSLEDAALLKGEILDGNKSGFDWNNGGR
jgi:NitT/TauT family transport system ATP-binding protein